MQATLEEGKHAREAALTDEQWKFTRSFRLLTEKPKMVLVNLADDDPADKYPPPSDAGQVSWATVPLRLEMDLAQIARRTGKRFCRSSAWRGSIAIR